MTRNRGIRTIAAAALVAVAFVGGCSSGRDDAESAKLTGEDAGVTDAAGGGAAATGGATTGAPAGASANASAKTVSVIPASVALPRIVRNATVRIEVKDGSFQKAFDAATVTAGEVGGFVASSSSAAGADDELASGRLTLRVPAERFDDVIGRLRELGKFRGFETRGDDVGAQITDIEARLRNLRAQEEAIRSLMSRTKDVGETLQIQGQLGAVREQIEQLDGQRARLADAVALATINVELNEPGAAPKGEPSPVSKAFTKAVDGAEAVVAAVIVTVGYLVPLALVALLALLVFRAATHGRRPVVAASGEHGA